MYERFYGLNRTPFAVTPDPAMLFMSKVHREALATIIYGVETRKGFIVCTGEVGTGKSTIVRAFFDQTREDAVKLIYIFTPQVTPFEMARYICRELGMADPESIFAAVPQLQLKLLEIFESGRTVVLMIDEAQLLPPETLEFLRLLSNFETDTEKLIQIVLVGQPEVDTMLARNDMRQVAQRVALRARLAPLEVEESYGYIEHRLRVCGARDLTQVLSPSAAWLIAEAAEGLPRRINILADNVLIAGFGAAQRPVTGQLAGTTVREFLAKSGAASPAATEQRSATGWRAGARRLRGALVREKAEPPEWVSPPTPPRLASTQPMPPQPPRVVAAPIPAPAAPPPPPPSISAATAAAAATPARPQATVILPRAPVPVQVRSNPLPQPNQSAAPPPPPTPVVIPADIPAPVPEPTVVAPSTTTQVSAPTSTAPATPPVPAPTPAISSPIVPPVPAAAVVPPAPAPALVIAMPPLTSPEPAATAAQPAIAAPPVRTSEPHPVIVEPAFAAVPPSGDPQVPDDIVFVEPAEFVEPVETPVETKEVAAAPIRNRTPAIVEPIEQPAAVYVPPRPMDAPAQPLNVLPQPVNVLPQPAAAPPVAAAAAAIAAPMPPRWEQQPPPPRLINGAPPRSPAPLLPYRDHRLAPWPALSRVRSGLQTSPAPAPARPLPPPQTGGAGRVG